MRWQSMRLIRDRFIHNARRISRYDYQHKIQLAETWFFQTGKAQSVPTSPARIAKACIFWEIWNRGSWGASTSSFAGSSSILAGSAISSISLMTNSLIDIFLRTILSLSIIDWSRHLIYIEEFGFFSWNDQTKFYEPQVSSSDIPPLTNLQTIRFVLPIISYAW